MAPSSGPQYLTISLTENKTNPEFFGEGFVFLICQYTLFREQWELNYISFFCFFFLFLFWGEKKDLSYLDQGSHICFYRIYAFKREVPLYS